MSAQEPTTSETPSLTPPLADAPAPPHLEPPATNVSSRSRALRFALTWGWLLVPVVGLAELAAHFHFAAAAPQPAAWQQLEAPLRALYQEGDLVVVAPYWAEPNARAVFGDTLMPLRDVARPDNSGYARAIELSILGQEAELEGFKSVQEQQVGLFRLRVLQNDAYRKVLVDFADLLGPETTTVSSRKGNNETPCPWNANARVSTGAPALHGHPTFPKARFQCSPNEWNFVGLTVIEDQHYRPHRCIWAHPGENKLTVLRFAAVELGSSITGHGGISYFLERESKGTPVEIEVLVDEESLGVYHHEDGEGWTGFEFSTADYQGEKHTVEFRVRSKRSQKREFCFHASVR